MRRVRKMQRRARTRSSQKARRRTNDIMNKGDRHSEFSIEESSVEESAEKSEVASDKESANDGENSAGEQREKQGKTPEECGWKHGEMFCIFLNIAE